MKQECTATHADPTATPTVVNQGIPRDEVIAHLTQLNTLLTVAADSASEASTDVLNAQVLESEIAAKVTADATKLMMTDLRQQFESALAAQVLSSKEATSTLTLQMAIERDALLQTALIASEQSTLLVRDLTRKHEIAAAAAALLLKTSLTAQLATFQLATEKAEAATNTRLALKRVEAKEAAVVARVASELLLTNLRHKYETAAVAAACASDSSLVAQRVASNLATEEAKVEANSRVATEQNAAKIAAIIASKASDTKFLDQKSRFEAMAAAAANASDSSLIAERHASQLASEVAELQATSRIAVARNESEEAALVASKASASKFLDQRLMYEAAASAAADASDSSLTAQRFASQLATEEAELEANSRMKIKRDESTQAALIASEASALQLVNLQLKYENAAAAAANASDSSLVAQRLASQQATEEAKVVAELRMTTERNASKQAAIIASEASDTKLLDQKSRYETAALAASDASETKMAFEQSIFEKSTKLASDAFAVKLSDNTRNTERLELQAKFALMESVQLRNISANVAHDLKSPLHTLLIGLESMRTGDNSSSSLLQNAEVLDTLNSACAFMTSAISRTIEFSKTSSGVSLTPSNSSFNLLSALNNPVKWIKSMLTPDGNKSITLGALPEGVSTLITDKHWVEENLLCLLSNAVKYSNEGVIHVAVTLEDRDGEHVRITVEDSGIGISSESKQLLFKQFSSVQNMAVGSTGLGLYSLSKRVEAIGGSCGVDDRKDGKEGSTFWFSFPHRPDIGEDVEKGSLLDTSSVPSDLRKSLDILIVDDSTSVVKILSNKLMRAGHRVVTASNGAAGLDKMIAMRGRLDVVFMDIQMPVMDGIEATKRYREIERLHDTGQHLPIICSTANSGGEAENLAMAAGVDSFLPKPFTTTVLLSVVDEVIRGLVA